MRQKLLFLILSSILVYSSGVWAAQSNEALIYTGPPEFGEVYDFPSDATAYVSYMAVGRDMEAHAGWWSVGGRMQNRWDSSHQGWSYLFANMQKELEVTAAGSASISFSWNGLLNVDGSSAYDNMYYLYAQASIEDTTLGANTNTYWYRELNAIGSMNISETATFNYLFDENDVGDLFTINLMFDSQVGLDPYNRDDIVFSNGDALEFSSMFYEGLKIDNITGGIAAADAGGPMPAVPLPPALWLFGSGLIALAGIRKEGRVRN